MPLWGLPVLVFFGVLCDSCIWLAAPARSGLHEMCSCHCSEAIHVPAGAAHYSPSAELFCFCSYEIDLRFCRPCAGMLVSIVWFRLDVTGFVNSRDAWAAPLTAIGCFTLHDKSSHALMPAPATLSRTCGRLEPGLGGSTCSSIVIPKALLSHCTRQTALAMHADWTLGMLRTHSCSL